MDEKVDKPDFSQEKSEIEIFKKAKERNLLLYEEI
jgi:hypothetical protein